jgi:DNA-directed RNA polymerase subunit H
MAQFVEKVFRSRQVLLEILRDRGYDTTGPDKFGPEEIRAALAAAPNGRTLEFTVKAKEGAKVPTPNVRVYTIMTRLKQRLPGFMANLVPQPGLDETSAARDMTALSSPVDPAQTSVICLINELDNENRIPDVFYKESAAAWRRHKIRLTFFSMDTLLFNPLKHVLVPKHEIVPEEQHEALLNSLYVLNKSQFPGISYSDAAVRVLGAVPGDIIKVTRASPTAGEVVLYRNVTYPGGESNVGGEADSDEEED